MGDGRSMGGGSGSAPTKLVHDKTLVGDGTDDSPLGVDPSALVPVAGDDPHTYLSMRGKWTLPRNSGLPGTGLLSIGSLPQISINVSREGNIDWYVFSQNPCSKIGGGWIAETFKWAMAGNSMTLDQSSVGSAVSSDARDSMANAALVFNTNKGRISSVKSPTDGWGFTFRVPALLAPRVLRVAVAQFSNIVRWKAHLTDGSAEDVFIDTDSESDTALASQIAITFAGGSCCELVFSGLVQSRYHANPSLSFGWATLSTP